MRHGDDFSTAIRELEKTELLNEPEAWQDGGRGTWTRHNERRRRELAEQELVSVTAGPWFCKTWLCRACGTRMWSEQTPFGPGWFGGGRVGCCWLQGSNEPL